MTFVWAVKCFRSFFTLLFAIETIRNLCFEMLILCIQNLKIICLTRAAQIRAIYIGRHHVYHVKPIGFGLGRMATYRIILGIFLKLLARYHCILLITVSPHSKLLVFLQTAHITPRNLIIGPYYVFSPFSVNMGNLWHAQPHTNPLKCSHANGFICIVKFYYFFSPQIQFLYKVQQLGFDQNIEQIKAWCLRLIV